MTPRLYDRGYSSLAWVALALLTSHVAAFIPSAGGVELRARVVGADSGAPLPARVYVHHLDEDRWFHVRTTAAHGSAVDYSVKRFDRSFEIHTTVSAHPFAVDLPPGEIEVTVERGHEYRPLTAKFRVTERGVAGQPAGGTIDLPLARWIDMAALGWFSGDTHVHRDLADLPNLVMAEDLNVALPLSYWVTAGGVAPTHGNKLSPRPAAELIAVDPTHVIYPMNTEYEIFTVGERRHTLGAVFVLNHKRPLELGAPPVVPIAQEARRQGALLDLDKHNWPWSMMLVPTMGVDLFELANNHIWRTEFGFKAWQPVGAPDFMRIERAPDGDGWSERGWIDFGFQSYYALLNCGFRLRPTAGTASGVHPVPLGFGRVYVGLPSGKFEYAEWIEHLGLGHSFVTTGPVMPQVLVGGTAPGHTLSGWRSQDVAITGTIHCLGGLASLEAVVDGQTIPLPFQNGAPDELGRHRIVVDARVPITRTGWVAVRCFQRRPDNRPRFAHTAPVWIEVKDRPQRPNDHEVRWLAGLMDDQIERNQGILSPAALDEYHRAKQAYLDLIED